MAGGYAGYAISWLGVPSELASQRAWRSLAAAIAGVAILIAALLLERACRVRNEDDAHLTCCSMASPTRAPAARRRQRSVRLTVAVALLVVAALLVLGAVLTGSWAVLARSPPLAARGPRRGGHPDHPQRADADPPRRRARPGRAGAGLPRPDRGADRRADGASPTPCRAASRPTRHAIVELEVALTSAQRRAAEATRKMNAEARRADVAERRGRDTAERLDEAEQRAAEAIVRVAELEAGDRRAPRRARRVAGDARPQARLRPPRPGDPPAAGGHRSPDPPASAGGSFACWPGAEESMTVIPEDSRFESDPDLVIRNEIGAEPGTPRRLGGRDARPRPTGSRSPG